MPDSDSDPKIVSRLNKLPPYTDAEGNIIDKPPEEPAKEPTEEAKEEVKPEPTPEVPEETPKEEAKEPEPIDEEEKEALENSKSPEHTKKYIEKLKEQNESLKRKNILESLKPEVKPEEPQWPQPATTNVVPTPQQFPGLTQNQINETFKNLVDENNYVDTGLLIQTLNDQQEKTKQAEERAKKAEERAAKTEKRIDDYERNQVMRQVHDLYPKLDPANADINDPAKKFDDRLWQFVRKGMVTEWIKDSTAGKVTDPNDPVAEQQRLLSLAQKGMDLLNNDLLSDEGEVDVSRLTMKKAEKEKMEQAEMAKRNINATVANQSTQREDYSDHEALVRATRMGVRGSLAERLRRAGQ